MSNKITHPYHIVDESPWPIYGSLSGIYLTTGFLSWFHLKDLTIVIVGVVGLILVIFQWWRDISREGTFQGLHTGIVELGLRSGMLLFIISEAFFFWGFFGLIFIVVFHLISKWGVYGLMQVLSLSILWGSHY